MKTVPVPTYYLNTVPVPAPVPAPVPGHVHTYTYTNMFFSPLYVYCLLNKQLQDTAINRTAILLYTSKVQRRQIIKHLHGINPMCPSTVTGRYIVVVSIFSY